MRAWYIKFLHYYTSFCKKKAARNVHAKISTRFVLSSVKFTPETHHTAVLSTRLYILNPGIVQDQLYEPYIWDLFGI